MNAIASIFPIAFGALRRNRMRSLLTSLGVIIGVGALIVTVASGEGSKAVLEEQLATLGTNLLIVLPGSSTLGGARGGPGTGKPLTHADLLAIVKGANAARYAAPVDRTVTQIVLDNQNWLTTVYGSTPDFFAIREWTPARGRLFNSSESDSGAKVCVLGQTVATQLFGVGDPLGQVVRVKSMPCEVVGVLVSKGQSSQGQDQDDLVVMPWVTFKSRMMSQDRIHVGSILVSAVSPDEVSHAQTQVSGVLRQQHRQADGELDDFTVRNPADLAATQEKAADAQTGMLRNVAAVSLSAAGGLIGIALGIAGSLALASTMGWPFVLSPFWIFIAFGISMAIGVVFGFYPARKAARMNPIDALRFE